MRLDDLDDDLFQENEDIGIGMGNPGYDLWQGGVYREVVEPERLVFTFAWDQEDGSRGPETLVTIDFVELGGKTRMIFRQSPFNTRSNRDGHSQGWNSAFDRLAEALAAA